MQEIFLRRKEGACVLLSVPGKEIASEPGWDHRFQVGNVVVRRVDGGTYNRSRIAEVAEKEKYREYYSLGFPC